MRKIIFLFQLLVFLPAFSQDTVEYKRCVTNEYYKKQTQRLGVFKQMPSARIGALVTFSGTIVIPIVVHVVHNNSDGAIGGMNISDDQILSQIKVLNEDYRRKSGTNGFNSDSVGADVQIEFQMAGVDPDCNPTNGITRHITTITSFDPYSNDIKQFEPWPGNEYLNIWVGNLANKTLGIAQFPNYSGLPGLDGVGGDFATDGVVIRYNAFGTRTATTTNDIYNLGRTATHEIGHWLGLIHTWGSDYCGDDYCDDTPQASDGNLNRDCRQVTSNCNGISNAEMIENYLDYSPDICMNIFTIDQKARMWQTMTTSPDRVNILNFVSNGINTKSVSPLVSALPINENFENESTNIAPVSFNCVGNQSLKVGVNSSLPGYFYNTGIINNTKNATYTLSYNYAYPSSQISDTLFLYGNIGCMSGKYLIASFLGDNLISTTSSGASFVPECTDWKTQKIQFTSPYSYFDLQFQTNQNFANNLYLDNIKLGNGSDLTNTTTSNNLRVEIWGNPVLDKKIKFKVFYASISNVEFEMIDMLGQKVFTQSQSQVSPGDFEIDVPNLNAGIYVVKTKVNNEITLTKVFLL